MGMTSHSSPILVRAEGLTKQYSSAGQVDVEVFRNLSLELQRGQITALIGPSGSGKSTLLHLLGTLDAPSSGSIEIAGEAIASLDDQHLSTFRNRHIGFIFQFHHLLPEFTALENVVMPALIAGKKIRDVEERAKMLLTEVGLSSRVSHRPGALSGGEAQRVAVARAFIMSPALVLADEPTGNLDVRNSQMLFDLIVGLSRKLEQTFLIATHNLELAHQTDRILHLEGGVLREDPIIR
jgi:lipoprotein-releasing system ATP-binding protein